MALDFLWIIDIKDACPWRERRHDMWEFLGDRGSRDVGSVKTEVSLSANYSFLAVTNAMMERILLCAP